MTAATASTALAAQPATNGTDPSKPFFHTKLFINNEVSDFTSLSQAAEGGSSFKVAFLCFLHEHISVNC
jgi:hypothetical protein